MKALILDSKVVEIQASPFPVAGALKWVDCPDDCQVGWVYDGSIVAAPVIPELSDREKLERFKDKVREVLSSQANEMGYDSVLSILSYQNSTNQKWKKESYSFLSWRDNVIDYAISVYNRVKDGSMSIPTLEEFENKMPKLKDE